jgi:regulator of nonsense transcripts 2
MELFIRHLVYDVLAKRTIDKVLKLIRKLDWNDASVRLTLYKVFTKPWKLNYGNVGLMAMLANDLNRYHPEFVVSVVDQVLEDIRRGLEQNVYSTNQRRVATVKYLGELYNYRLLGSGIIFDMLWSLVTFGHRKHPPSYVPCGGSTFSLQPTAAPSPDNPAQLTCPRISLGSGLFVSCWTPVACASTEDPRSAS